MDVHKSFLVACVASTNGQGVTSYKSKRFSTFTGDLRRLALWLTENDCKDVCMESTRKYWIPIYNILETTCNIVLAHPKYVKAIRGKKTDKKDAKWIADIFKHDLVSGSFIPPADIRQLRDLVRYRLKLTNFMSGEKNRAQNCLTVSNIKLDDVFTDVFGKASSAIITRLLENNEPFDVKPYLTKGIKASTEQIQSAVDGEICSEQAEKLRIIRSHMEALELCKLNLESLILSLAEKYLPQLDLLLTVPGIKTFSAIGIIAEIGVDNVQSARREGVPDLEASLLVGRAYAAEQRDCRQEENHQNQQSRSLHQTCARSVRIGSYQEYATSRNQKTLPLLEKAPGSQESHHRHCENSVDCHLQHSQKERALQSRVLSQRGQATRSPRGIA